MEQKLSSKRDLYRLMVSQLFYDGHQAEALALARAAGEDSACPPSTRLAALVAAGLGAEAEARPEPDVTPSGLDLDAETEGSGAPSPADYETVYVTAHKSACRAGAFSACGGLVATGSVDASIKVLDAARMRAKAGAGAGQHDDDTHPVVRTLYDHEAEVTCLAFHPSQPLLLSGSEDCSVKLYDLARPQAKRAQRTLSETSAVRALAMHPGGGHVLVATLHPTVRLYDVRTLQCFVAADPRDQHAAPVVDAAWDAAGALLATAAEDGAVRLWDGVSARVVAAFPRAHDGADLVSVAFSRNGKYLLSAARDGLVKLWELAMARCLIAYTGGAGGGGRRACLSHTEDFVLLPDDKSLCSWDARNAERKPLLSLGHSAPVRFLAHSPVDPSFLSCSDDARARFWTARPSPSGA